MSIVIFIFNIVYIYVSVFQMLKFCTFCCILVFVSLQISVASVRWRPLNFIRKSTFVVTLFQLRQIRATKTHNKSSHFLTARAVHLFLSYVLRCVGCARPKKRSPQAVNNVCGPAKHAYMLLPFPRFSGSAALCVCTLRVRALCVGSARSPL